ncbi:FAD/NAD-P-binding domain-containing protein [Auriscalpium vulgare]|uniref:FAD/NAD-P-binding domain-containing protein n=1 Tax=Auriscalpium vulgare TaxID=40419 RepID=A0ACB8RNF5_9AGAM|nr:FAD/NAD-P-binding domain-containing protein [Auriscalpium vulgare]
MKHVLIVGGGGAGTVIARKLSTQLDPKEHTLTLVTARPFYIFLPATVRMAVTEEGHMEERVLIPYDRMMKGIGQLKVGRVVEISRASEKAGGKVVLEDGQTIDYDVLVLAPGTALEGPLAYPDTESEILDTIHVWREKFRGATNIVMAGGGPVNVEFAGEIKETWPDKKVTIVQSGKLPLHKIYPDHFRKRIATECQLRGIDFVFEDYLDQEVPENGTVKTRNGKMLTADLVIPARGGSPATAFIKSLDPEVVTPRGLVKADPTLQVTGHPGVFCAGDVVDNSERNRLGKYAKHASVVAANVLAHLKGRPVSKRYRGSLEIISISLGKNGGVSYIGIFGGIVLGNFFTWLLQSRTLLLPKGRRRMGY